MSDSKGAAIDEQIMDIFMEAVALRITPKQYTDAILAILAQEVNKARIDELENFQWNDPHFWVNLRLSKLRDETKD